MSEKVSTTNPKKQWTNRQAITVMVVGGLMLLLSIVIPTEEQSTAHTIKVVIGFLGAYASLLWGAHFRPMKAPKDPKE